MTKQGIVILTFRERLIWINIEWITSRSEFLYFYLQSANFVTENNLTTLLYFHITILISLKHYYKVYKRII